MTKNMSSIGFKFKKNPFKEIVLDMDVFFDNPISKCFFVY